MISTPFIGKVQSKFAESANPRVMREEDSQIEIFEEYTGGLLKIELYDYIEVTFSFHKAEPFKLTTFSHTGDFKGIFATRSPSRPSKIGSTIVKLIAREGNILKVRGLDALDGTPVIDIKPIHIPFTDEQLDETAIHSRKISPRKNVISNIRAKRTDLLLLDAAQLHGHYCSGLALGVMMAVKAMQLCRYISEDPDDLRIIAEANNCFLDGIQLITGCTFGNKKLILKETGKVAFTALIKDEKVIKISLRSDAEDYIKQLIPHADDLSLSESSADCYNYKISPQELKEKTDRAFALLNLDFDRIFEMEEVV